jgi:hypothetical protein
VNGVASAPLAYDPIRRNALHARSRCASLRRTQAQRRQSDHPVAPRYFPPVGHAAGTLAGRYAQIRRQSWQRHSTRSPSADLRENNKFYFYQTNFDSDIVSW